VKCTGVFFIISSNFSAVIKNGFLPERSSSFNRADGFARDKADPEFRQMMGPGIYPYMEKAIFPLKYLWMCVGLAIVTRHELRLIPIVLVRGIVEPGSLSGAQVLLRNV